MLYVSLSIYLLKTINVGMSQAIDTKAKATILDEETDLSVDLTLHDVPASLIAEFAEKIVRPYYHGNLNAAVQDLIYKALSEQDFIHSHITHVRNATAP